MINLTCPTLPQTALHQLGVMVCHVVRAAGLAAVLSNGAAAAQGALLDPASLQPPANPQLKAPESRQVELLIDFAVILQITGDVSVIVLGNSDIADASVVAVGSGAVAGKTVGTVALTGKAVGTTNVVVLGPDGGVLAELRVQVAAHKPGAVTVRRALLPSIYACTASSCQRSDNGTDKVSSP